MSSVIDKFGSGAAEDEVGGAGGVVAGSADEEVVVAVAVDVASGRYDASCVVTGRLTSEYRVGRRNIGRGGRSRPQDDVRSTRALATAVMSIEHRHHGGVAFPVVDLSGPQVVVCGRPPGQRVTLKVANKTSNQENDHGAVSWAGRAGEQLHSGRAERERASGPDAGGGQSMATSKHSPRAPHASRAPLCNPPGCSWSVAGSPSASPPAEDRVQDVLPVAVAAGAHHVASSPEAPRQRRGWASSLVPPRHHVIVPPPDSEGSKLRSRKKEIPGRCSGRLGGRPPNLERGPTMGWSEPFTGTVTGPERPTWRPGEV